MCFAKQTDGKSWLFYEKTNAGKRNSAIACMRFENGEPFFDLRHLAGTEADEAALQKRFQALHESIQRKITGIAIHCEGQTEEKYLTEIVSALEISKRVSSILREVVIRECTSKASQRICSGIKPSVKILSESIGWSLTETDIAISIHHTK